ncbi:MAG: polymerase, sigma-24 subunit, subfamily [Deferribacteraceae bacterium]|jgi:RNA polymerase sigma-70 factor (ECF subfamily)|nr:polymerase, sigma-24 subunit, subfamily [Deferribacteraceae bacterium]
MNHFHNFFEKTKRGFYNYLLSLTRDSDFADDIFQETYYKILKNYTENLSPGILYKIGKNLFIDAYNKNKKHLAIEDINLNYNNEDDARLEAEALLRMLEDDEKQVFLMSAVDGLKYEEISKVTGMSVANIKVKIFRARKKIQQKINGGQR